MEAFRGPIEEIEYLSTEDVINPYKNTKKLLVIDGTTSRTNSFRYDLTLGLGDFNAETKSIVAGFLKQFYAEVKISHETTLTTSSGHSAMYTITFEKDITTTVRIYLCNALSIKLYKD